MTGLPILRSRSIGTNDVDINDQSELRAGLAISPALVWEFDTKETVVYQTIV